MSTLRRFAVAEGFTIVTPEFQMVFPNLDKPRAFKQNGKEKGEPMYGLTMLFTPADVEVLKKKAAEAAKAKWPSRAFSELKFPFHNGDTLAAKAEAARKDGSFYKGKVVIKANSKFAPQVVGPDKQPLIDMKKVFSGCYGYAELNFHAYDGVNGGQDGVKAYVNFVMVSRPGQRIAGKDATTVFAGIAGGKSEHNPVADDEIPF